MPLFSSMNQRYPFVSVVLPFYNEEKYIENSIKSILKQTYDNFELILIDDYSSDTTLKICQGFKDRRIRIISKTNEAKGLAESRNLAIKYSNGDYILLQDADDISHEHRLERLLKKAIENPKRNVVGSWINIEKKNKTRILKLPVYHDDIVKGFNRKILRATIVAGAILASKNIFIKFPYRVKFKYMQDWDQLLRMHESGEIKFHNIPQPLYSYFVRKKGVKSKKDWINYNYFVRDCQRKRSNGIIEFGSIDEFMLYLGLNKFQNIKWIIFKNLLKLKLSIFG